MRVPDSLESLMAEGIITEVVRPLMSGKEAQIYLVESGGERRVAKIYKDAIHRSFKHRAEYTEGRGTRSTRDARAMQKRSKHGRAMDEEAWRSAEVDVIHRLRAAGVRVPEPFQFVDGVLIMELVKDAHGEPAPRLGDVELGAAEARAVFDALLRSVVRMLVSGVVHGDLSDFNVLLGADGPVIIDFPQAVDPSKNTNARELLIRDVDNLTRFLARYEPEMRGKPFAQEMWAAYETNALEPDSVLTGQWKPAHKVVDTHAVLRELEHVEREETRRRESRGLAPLGGKQRGPSGGGQPQRPAVAAQPEDRSGGRSQRADRAPAQDPRPAQEQRSQAQPVRGDRGPQDRRRDRGNERPSEPPRAWAADRRQDAAPGPARRGPDRAAPRPDHVAGRPDRSAAPRDHVPDRPAARRDHVGARPDRPDRAAPRPDRPVARPPDRAAARPEPEATTPVAHERPAQRPSGPAGDRPRSRPLPRYLRD